MDTSVKSNKDIEIFDIVSGGYTDISGKNKIGLFVVIYKEEFDENDYNNRNITGLKLTSKDIYANMYRTLIKREKCPELKTNSYVYSNKVYTLLEANCKFVCKLDQEICLEISSKLNTYLHQVNDQVFEGLIKKLKNKKDNNDTNF